MSKKVFRNLIVVGILLVVASFCFYDVAVAFAADNNDITAGLDTVGGGAGLVKANLKVTIGKIIKIILGFLGIIAISLVLYGGYLYMTSGGEADKVSTAKKYLINAGIGLAIILLSYAIVSFVLSSLQAALGDSTYKYACSDGKDNDGDKLTDWPADPNCKSATYYSEYPDLSISGEAYLRATGIVPQGKLTIINVHPRITFNQAVKDTTVNLTNIKITSATGSTDQVFPVKPSKVTESNGNSVDILNQIKEKDSTFNANWVVCSAPYQGNTPMVVEYDLTTLTQAKVAKLNFNSVRSGDAAQMTVSCSKTGTDFVEMEANKLFENGENTLDLRAECLGSEKVYIKWARVASDCLKFEYMWLDVTASVPYTVAGTFNIKNGGRLVEFVPDGTCSPGDPSTYSLKADTEYTVTLNDKGLISADGDALLCGGSNPCTAKFTTGNICDVTPPTVNFDILNKSICQFPALAPDDVDVKFLAEDDAGISVVSLNVDDDTIGEDSPDGNPTPTIFDSFIPWAVNDSTLGEHQLLLTVEDVDGNSGTKKTNVFLRPDSCCDVAGNILCCDKKQDPACNLDCGVCDEGPCESDIDCANGYCEKAEGATTGICVPFPLINNINPKEGIDGNFVTIYGSGFSDYLAGTSKVWLSAGTTAETKYTLEAELGCKPSDAWTANQIIVKIPKGIETGPIKVINKKSKFDDTEDSDGFEGDFVKNPNLRYPGLCSMDPSSGIAGTLVTLGGEKFGDAKTANDNIYFGTATAVVTGNWSDSLINAVRVPQINKGVYNVVVGKGERCQKPKADCAEGSESCLVDCVREVCKKADNSTCKSGESGCTCVVIDAACNCYNVMSNPKSFTLDNPASVPTITDVSPKSCTAIAATACALTDEGKNGCVCVSTVPVESCILNTSIGCVEGSFVDCTCIAGAVTTVCENNDGDFCSEGEPDCVCTDTTAPKVCTLPEGSNCIKDSISCTCTTPAVTKTCSKHDTCAEGSPGCSCSGDAPKNQMITISGTSFGDKQGQVIFTPLQVVGNGFAEAVDEQGNLVPSFIGVLACGQDSWSDTQVVVKVPESKTIGGVVTPMALGNYWVKILTNQSLPSNSKNFIVNNNAPGPGICSISPNNGPANTLVTLSGENFGDIATRDLSFVKDIKKSNVNFKDISSRIEASKSGGIVWSPSKIEKAKVPAAAVTGGVAIHSSFADGMSILSNAVNFNVGVCTETSCAANQFCCGNGVCTPAGDGATKQSVCAAEIITHESEYAWVMSTGIIPKIPAVIERACMITDEAGYRQSVSPAKDEKLACPNGLISATFNMDIDEATLNNNVVIKRCTGANLAAPCDFAVPAQYVSRTLGTLNSSDVNLQPASITCMKAGAICKSGEAGCVCTASNEELTSFSLDKSFSAADSTVVTAVQIGAATQYRLLPNNWYQVVIRGGEGGVAANALSGIAAQVMPADYVWTFKTRATNCQPDNFLMSPSKATIESVQQVKSYRVTGMFQCQELSMSDKPWDWSVLADNPEEGAVPDTQKAQSVGYGCVATPILGADPFCPSATGYRDIGVYAVHSGALSGSCNQFDPDCERTVTKDVETTVVDPITIQANAVVPEETLAYEKTGTLLIDFSKPRVTSYYPNCKEACINAQLGAKFSTKMKESSVELPANIKIYSCETEECTTVTAFDSSSANLEYTYNPATSSFAGDNILRISLAANKNLLPNKFFRVVLSGQIESISGVKLVDLNYRDPNIAGQGFNSFSWVFKTKNDPNQCVIDNVGVVPGNYVAGQPGEKIKYAVDPKSAPDKCSADGQILNPLNYNWTWTAPDDANGGNNDGIPLVVLTQNVYNLSTKSKCTDKCLLKGSTTYRAVCGDGVINTGEECEVVGAETKMMVANVLTTVTGVNCNATTCLLNNFSACSTAELTNGAANCCGNGQVNGQEECDLGAAYLDKNGVACTPPGTTEAPCVLVSKAKSCTAGCLNAGTATGYLCGNGVKEAGEDYDDGNKSGGDGISPTCLNEGAETVYKTTAYPLGIPVCGNHIVEDGEKCDPLASVPAANKALCNNKCLVTGFPLCTATLTTQCCGNGTLDTIDGLGIEDCEKTSCFKEEACPTMADNMLKCTSVPATPGCSIVNGTCVCKESNTCGSDGKIKVTCNKGEAGCVCDFPADCSNKCTNLGSNIKYGSQCGNSTAEVGEDAACETGTEGTKVSPYQTGTINTEKSSVNNNVYQVILRLSADMPLTKKTYSFTPAKHVVASTTEKINNVDTAKSGQADVNLRVSDSVYNQAVADTCVEDVNFSPHPVPANNAINVCRNASLFLSVSLKDIVSTATEQCLCPSAPVTYCQDDNENVCLAGSQGCNCTTENPPDDVAPAANCALATKVQGCYLGPKQNESFLFYYESSQACPAGKDVTSLVLAQTETGSVNWFVGVYHKVVEFVRAFLFKVGIAANPNYCRGPEIIGDIKILDNGTEMRGIPKELLAANTKYGLKISNLQNKCGDALTGLPYTLHFTTGNDVCLLDNVVVAPSDVFVMQSHETFNYTAYPKSGDQDIFPVPGVYSWVWGWQSSDTALAQISSSSGSAAQVETQTKNGEGVITANATIVNDALGVVCNKSTDKTTCTPGTDNCVCTKTGPGTIGQQFSGYGNIKVFICDNPWFGDVYNSYNRAIPPEYQYSSSQSSVVHKKFDLKLEYANSGQLKPSYLVEKEFNAGLFYCRDFGKAKDLSDDLPLVGLMAGAFTEINPVPRFGAYFDRNFDYVESNDSFAFMNSATSKWTISNWVYSDDLPTDRYVRLFYKNLSSNPATAGVPNQDHVQLGVRSWCLKATPGCWKEVMNGTKTPVQCDASCTPENIKRSVVFKIKYGNNIIYKGVQTEAGLLNNGFNQIVLSYNNGTAILYVNGLPVAMANEDATTAMFVWPRGEACTAIPPSTCQTEMDLAGADFDKLFIGGLGKTKVPLVSFGGYIDDFRVYNVVKTAAQVTSDPETGLAPNGKWEFNAGSAGSADVNGAPWCTPDYSVSCIPANCQTPGKNGCSCTTASQCLASNKFKSINLTNIAKEKGFYFGSNSGWKELSVGTENQCNDGLDNDNNGLTDSLDPKCTSVNDGWEEPAMFAQYFFVRKDDADYPATNDQSPDAISLRIYENPEALPPKLWYARYAPNPAASVPNINSDCLRDNFGEFCYVGVQDGRTLYISASNINISASADSASNVYNNIYLLSYSQDASPATQNIFGQILEFLKFNMNVLDTASISKIKVIRDTQRLQDFVLMHEYVSVYKSQNSGHVPQLESGTLQRHKSFSVWDSWANEFSKEIGSVLPKDPLNRLANEPPAYRCVIKAGVGGAGFGCTQGELNCECEAARSVPCGGDIYGIEKACLATEQCVEPGLACVRCGAPYDSKACYNSSTQTFANLYAESNTYFDENYTYSYESKSASTPPVAGDYTKYRIKLNYEIKATPVSPSALNYISVPVIVPDAPKGWDSVQVDPAVNPVALQGTTECSDGIDNDKNGKIDYPNDKGCDSAQDDLETGIYACGDGKDNEGDGTCDFAGCTCNVGNQYCGTDKAYLNGTIMPKDQSCSAVFDNDELHPTQCSDGIDNDGDGAIDAADQQCINENDNSEKGLPKGNVLFAFFVDDSGSMKSKDSNYGLITILKAIVEGYSDAEGIQAVKGNQAHYLFTNSGGVCGSSTACTAEQIAALNFTMKYPLTSNTKNGDSAPAFLSYLSNTTPKPFTYGSPVSLQDMPPRISMFMQKVVQLYLIENSDGDAYNYSGLVFIIVTDATDGDTGTTYRQAAVDAADAVSAPIHLIFIGSPETRACSDGVDNDNDGLKDMSDSQCDHPLNSSEVTSNNFISTDYTYYMRKQTTPPGIYERGAVADIKTLLPKIIGAIASIPEAVPDISDAY